MNKRKQIALNKLLEIFAYENVCGVTGNTINDNYKDILSLYSYEHDIFIPYKDILNNPNFIDMDYFRLRYTIYIIMMSTTKELSKEISSFLNNEYLCKPS